MSPIATRIGVMAELQDAYNRQVHPDWRDQGYPYYRAIWVECAELLDHFGWKWWKHQRPDLDQVKLEIVDIWHFGLSELLRAGRVASGRVDPTVVRAIEAGGREGVDFKAAVEALAASTLAERDFPVDAFMTVMRTLPMSFDELFLQYVGKNVLNQFRLDHGYRSGEYRKLWGGVEDNVHLIELATELDDGAPGYADALYRALADRYTASASS